MRKDGSIIYYTIERKLKKIEDGSEFWCPCDLNLFSYNLIPKNIQMKHNSCGKCWQKYGYNGLLDKDIANCVYTLLKNAIKNNIEVNNYRGFGYNKELYATMIDCRLVKNERTRKTTIIK